MHRWIVFGLVLAGCDGLPDGVELPTSERTDLAAVGLLTERCSITAIDVGGAADAPAYALTAGHCTGFSQILAPEVINAGDALGAIRFGLFVDAEDRAVEVETVTREYASLVGIDLGVYRLDATIGELRAAGIEPIALADGSPPEGAPISIASFPHQTDDDPDRVLHLSHCDQGPTVRLAEGSIVFIDFMANHCHSIRDGSSGGAVLDQDGRLFAVQSTVGEPLGGATPCTLDHPCEVHGDRPTFREDTVYVSPIRNLAACFPGGLFDLEGPGCSLTRPQLPVFAGSDFVGARRWSAVLVDAGLPFYRTKAGLATEVRCEDDDGWSAPFAIAERPQIDDPIPSEPAGEPYVLCVQGQLDAGEAPRERFLDRTTMLQTLL